MSVIDADQHLDEYATMWASYTPEKDRELAITVTTDDRGYSWLTFQGKPFMMMDVYEPLDHERVGDQRALWRNGQPIPEHLRYENQPPDHTDTAGRLQRLDEWGIHEAVLYPNWGFLWEGVIHRDLDAVRVNCAAWNRWAADVTTQSNGRLRPVGHLTLQGGSQWAIDQIKALGRNGVRMAMFSPGLINGIRMSHRDYDHIWHAFVASGVTPCWHVDSRMSTVFANHEAWADNDRDNHVQLMPFLFNNIAAQMGLSDFAVNGVFARHPDLKVVIAECGARWFPQLLDRTDAMWHNARMSHGRSFNPDLKKLPSEYMAGHGIITCSFPYDATARMVAKYPTVFSFGSDYPHPEGQFGLEPWKARMDALPHDADRRFYGDNIGAVLH
jgi:predicted TIM-barrel fold metal-dependent hydrolase